MKYHHVTTLLVLAALLGHAGQIHAQRPQPKDPEQRYEELKKSPFLAGTLELIIPTLGHDYAGDRDAGKPMAGLMIVGGGHAHVCHRQGCGRFLWTCRSCRRAG